VPDEEKNDLTTEAERLCERLSMEKFGHEFLFVTDYGPEKRAFYHMRKDGRPEGYDLIWRGVEITTGAQREHRYERLKAQADEKGLGEDVKFYLEFFRYGCPPHGGFGSGRPAHHGTAWNRHQEAMFLFRGRTASPPEFPVRVAYLIKGCPEMLSSVPGSPFFTRPGRGEVQPVQKPRARER
jgi:aspartyl-tRNA synthetase